MRATISSLAMVQRGALATFLCAAVGVASACGGEAAGSMGSHGGDSDVAEGGNGGGSDGADTAGPREATDTLGHRFEIECSAMGSCTASTDEEDVSACADGRLRVHAEPHVPLICDFVCNETLMPHFVVLDVGTADVCRPIACSADDECPNIGERETVCHGGVCHFAGEVGQGYTAQEVWALCAANSERVASYDEPDLKVAALIESACGEQVACWSECEWASPCAIMCGVSVETKCELPEECTVP